MTKKNQIDDSLRALNRALDVISGTPSGFSETTRLTIVNSAGRIRNGKPEERRRAVRVLIALVSELYRESKRTAKHFIAPTDVREAQRKVRREVVLAIQLLII